MTSSFESRQRCRSESRCPNCGADLVPDAVLCIACGYHLKKGTRLTTTVERLTQTVTDDANRHSSLAAARADNGRFAAFFSAFWIAGRIPRWQWWAYSAGFSLVKFSLRGLLDNRLVPAWWLLAVLMFALWIWFVAQVKRWHDMDKSGWWCLVNLIPLVGNLYALIELGFQRGTEGVNEYGEDPLASQRQLKGE